MKSFARLKEEFGEVLGSELTGELSHRVIVTYPGLMNHMEDDHALKIIRASDAVKWEGD